MNLSGCETTDELKAALQRAVGHKASPQEKFLQKVSFVYGQDFRSPHTKREVAAKIAEWDGYPLEWVELVA